MGLGKDLDTFIYKEITNSECNLQGWILQGSKNLNKPLAFCMLVFFRHARGSNPLRPHILQIYIKVFSTANYKWQSQKNVTTQ